MHQANRVAGTPRTFDIGGTSYQMRPPTFQRMIELSDRLVEIMLEATRFDELQQEIADLEVVRRKIVLAPIGGKRPDEADEDAWFKSDREKAKRLKELERLQQGLPNRIKESIRELRGGLSNNLVEAIQVLLQDDTQPFDVANPKISQDIVLREMDIYTFRKIVDAAVEHVAFLAGTFQRMTSLNLKDELISPSSSGDSLASQTRPGVASPEKSPSAPSSSSPDIASTQSLRR